MFIFYFRGLNCNTILSNLLFVYNDPANLVLVVNSSEHEEKYFMEKFNLAPLPNLGQERYSVWFVIYSIIYLFNRRRSLWLMCLNVMNSGIDDWCVGFVIRNFCFVTSFSEYPYPLLLCRGSGLKHVIGILCLFHFRYTYVTPDVVRLLNLYYNNNAQSWIPIGNTL